MTEGSVREQQGESWRVGCSDDEKYETKSKWTTVGDMEVPSAEDIASLHEVLCVDRVLALEWQCYGRRPPTPEGGHVIQTETTEKAEDKSDDFFDFDMDDIASQPKLPVRRREGELKGGARKKTTSFDGILSNMKRHRKLDGDPQP